ncbi:chemotaxis protein CheW [Hyphomicrobium sp. ghe19]|uniref:chemotaxis protein CheW n=1 Tax=Hyphomicrobium sp. ghe19 TaxID=2682968 RepID=UPI001367738C|nr:Chemotaxis protein CheW [Hyphomicrobium sp. ghe19]
MQEDGQNLNTKSGMIEVLTFDLQGETFALGAGIVREIMDMAAETRVPGAPRFVGGVINFRGKVIPLANLRLAFGMEARAATIDSRIVVIELDLDGTPTLIGLQTDHVHEVTTLDLAASEPPPSVGMRWRSDYVTCLVKKGSDFIVLPNLQTIFSDRSNSVGGSLRAVA